MKLTVAIASGLSLLFANTALGLAVRDPTPTDSTPTATSKVKPRQAACENRTKFQFFGVNQSGAEFGENNIPGALSTDYTWPSPSSVDVRHPILLISHNNFCLTTHFFPRFLSVKLVLCKCRFQHFPCTVLGRPLKSTCKWSHRRL